jgi:hypothetical protein
MGNVQGTNIDRMEDDLRLLRAVSPEAAYPIDWEQERSVCSHVCVNTMMNQINIEQNDRRQSLPVLVPKGLEQIVKRVMPRRRSREERVRTVSFSAHPEVQAPVQAVGLYSIDEERK